MIGLRTDIRRTMLFLYPICQYLRLLFALRAHTNSGPGCLVIVQLVGTSELTDAGTLCLFLFFFFFPSFFSSPRGRGPFFQYSGEAIQGQRKSKAAGFPEFPHCSKCFLG